MKKLLLWFLGGAAFAAAAPGWLDRVAPVITPSEKKTYLALQEKEREDFEERFWADKAISAEEYFRRLDHIDAVFGSNRPGSGANTDPGRVYLSLGAPVRITHVPSSGIFVPLEIWYYDSVPGLLSTELRLIFYQPNTMGFPKLYSAVLDTIRVLLLPQAGTRSLFGPNSSITESSIRQNLKVGPAEDEVISASVNVATGIRHSGNDEILGQISSPQQMLGKAQRTRVTSRLIVSRPKLDIMETPSPYGGSQVDFQLETVAQGDVDLEVLQGAVTVYHNRIHLNFSKVDPILYRHRLDLLPGSYRVVFTVDGVPHPYPVVILPQPAMGEIVRVEYGTEDSKRRTAFEFEGKQLELSDGGRLAAVTLPRPSIVTWTIRKGTQMLWGFVSEGQQIAIVELPFTRLAPGAYTVEALSEGDSQNACLMIKPEAVSASNASVVSFAANLAPASRYAFIGPPRLLRGQLA